MRKKQLRNKAPIVDRGGITEAEDDRMLHNKAYELLRELRDSSVITQI